MRRRVSGSMTVNVTEASIDMFTPPCSPNSCRALASEVAGLKTVPFCVAVASFFFVSVSSSTRFRLAGAAVGVVVVMRKVSAMGLVCRRRE